MNIIIDLMVETVIQIKSGMMVNVGASVRNISFIDNSVITCNKITNAKPKSYNE